VFVCILLGKAVPEMSYIVSGKTLNPTHTLTYFPSAFDSRGRLYRWADMLFLAPTAETRYTGWAK